MQNSTRLLVQVVHTGTAFTVLVPLMRYRYHLYGIGTAYTVSVPFIRYQYYKVEVSAIGEDP